MSYKMPYHTYTEVTELICESLLIDTKSYTCCALSSLVYFICLSVFETGSRKCKNSIDCFKYKIL